MANGLILETLREMLAEQRAFRKEMRGNFAKVLDQLDRIAAQYRAGTIELRELASRAQDRGTS